VLTELWLIGNDIGDDCIFVFCDAVRGRSGFVLELM